MLPLIAIPVVHSAGGWIASTAASGYIAGTLSTTWAGAFIAGNSALAAGIAGIGAGAAGAATFLSGSATSAAASVGLISTTPAWAVPAAVAAGTVAVSGVAVTILLKRKMKEINEERVKGGLEPLTVKELIKEIRNEQSK